MKRFKRLLTTACLLTCVWFGLTYGANAQYTNAASISAAVVAPIAQVFQDAVTVGVAAMVVGFAVYFIRKGLRLRG